MREAKYTPGRSDVLQRLDIHRKDIDALQIAFLVQTDLLTDRLAALEAKKTRKWWQRRAR